MIWSQAFPYVAMQVYSRQGDNDSSSSSSRLSENELRSALIALTLVWAACVALVALSIKRKYWRSFVSSETGSNYAIRTFREATTDESRLNAAFSNHRSFIAPIEAEVKQWLSDRYTTWQVERPAWFTEAAIASIPNDMLPKEALWELIVKGGGTRRRSSVGERLNARNATS